MTLLYVYIYIRVYVSAVVAAVTSTFQKLPEKTLEMEVILDSGFDTSKYNI